jgi:hypothetical protein
MAPKGDTTSKGDMTINSHIKNNEQSGIALSLYSPGTLHDRSCDPFLSWRDVKLETNLWIDVKRTLDAVLSLPACPKGAETDNPSPESKLAMQPAAADE